MKKLVKIALLLASCVQLGAQAGELSLYSRPNFDGREVNLRGVSADLNEFNFNDRTSSVVVHSGRWEVCEHADFGGRCMVLERGEYPDMGRLDNAISSVRELEVGRRHRWRDIERARRDEVRDEGRGRGQPVVLFEHARFEGRQVGVYTDMRSLRDVDFNDKLSSFIINDGFWELCEHADFRGQCMTFGPGSYAGIVMNDQISSLRRVR